MLDPAAARKGATRHPSWPSTVGRATVVLVIDALGVRVGALILPGVTLSGVGALAAVALIALVNTIIWPTLSRLVLPFSALTRGLGSLLLSGGMIWIAGQLTSDFHVNGILCGVALAFVWSARTRVGGAPTKMAVSTGQRNAGHVAARGLGGHGGQVWFTEHARRDRNSKTESNTSMFADRPVGVAVPHAASDRFGRPTTGDIGMCPPRRGG